jgi:hypothetical protein
MHKTKDGRTVESSVEARQGFLGRPMLIVLTVSLSMIIALYALIFFGFFGVS